MNADVLTAGEADGIAVVSLGKSDFRCVRLLHSIAVGRIELSVCWFSVKWRAKVLIVVSKYRSKAYFPPQV